MGFKTWWKNADKTGKKIIYGFAALVFVAIVITVIINSCGVNP